MNELLTQQPIYVVLVTALIVWAGIAFYLWRVDSRLSAAERRRQH